MSPENQGKATSLAESFFGIGSMFGPSIGGFLFDTGGFPLPFWVFGATALVLAAVSHLFLKDVQEAFEEGANSRDVTWKEILTSPGKLQGFVSGLMRNVAINSVNFNYIHIIIIII